jgi:hypothetical protein
MSGMLPGDEALAFRASLKFTMGCFFKQMRRNVELSPRLYLKLDLNGYGHFIQA